MTRSADRLKALAAKTRKQYDLDDMPKPTKLKGKSLADKARETFKKLRPKTQDELDLESMRGLQNQFPPRISEIPSEPKARKQRVATPKAKAVEKPKPAEKKEPGIKGNLWSMPSGAKGYVPELKKTEKQKPAKKEESGKSKPRNKKIKKSSPGYDMFGGTSATGHRPAR